MKRRELFGRLVRKEIELEFETVRRDATTFVCWGSKRVGLRGRVAQVTKERVRVGQITRTAEGYRANLHGERFLLAPAPELPAQLEVLLVRGLACSVYERIGPALDENEFTFEALGIPVLRAPVSSLASVADNAEVLRRVLRDRVAAGRRVLVVAHSKGVADTVAALADARDLWPHVYGVIGIQSAYRGSPIADLMDSMPMLAAAVGQAFDVLVPKIAQEDGGREAILDLRRAVCSAREHRERPEQIFAQVPLLTVRSWLDKGSRGIEADMIHDPLAQGFLPFMRRHGPSDGMVLLEDQRVPGAWGDLVFDQLSHAETILRGSQTELTPCLVTQRMLSALVAARAQGKPLEPGDEGRVDAPLGVRSNMRQAPKPRPRRKN